MTQTLCPQIVAVAKTNLYRSQNNLKQPLCNTSSAAKRSRNRGIILIQWGWQKLMQARILHDEFGCRYTYEHLSERSLLDVRTVSRLLSCEVKVDKGTLKTFFRAFNLPLAAGDYTSPKTNGASDLISDAATHQAPTMQTVKF